MSQNPPKDVVEVASHALFGWVPVSECQPTELDAHSLWGLWLWMPEYAEVGPQLGRLEDLHKATHWQVANPKADPFVPPSLPNVKDLARRALDSE